MHSFRGNSLLDAEVMVDRIDSGTDTETELLFSQEGYLAMKEMQPNLSDLIDDINMKKNANVSTC